MEILPAIDIVGGEVVRLTEGDYDRIKVYSKSPIDIARSFKDAGATNLHLVDLDGAKCGEMSNYITIKNIVESTSMKVEVGGGIRTEERIESYLLVGVERVILGTAAVNNFAFLTAMVNKYGKHIAVGVDARDGFVAVEGWLTLTSIKGDEFCKRVRDIGVETVIYTDIAKDGVMQGTNLEVYDKLKDIEGLNIIASGGVSFIEEITALRKMGIYGAIVGKAIYEGKLDLKAVIKEATK